MGGELDDRSPVDDEQARKLFDLCLRVAMEVAARPLLQREVCIAVVEQALRDGFTSIGAKGAQLDDLVEKHVELMRQFVHEIDVGGCPQGGNA